MKCLSLLLALFCAACVTNQVPLHKVPGQLFEINMWGMQHSAVVEFKDGHTVSAEFFNVGLDSATWVNGSDLNSLQGARISELHQVTFKDEARGALYGMTGGMVIGGGIGATFDSGSKTTSLGFVGGLLFGELAGGMVGTIIGTPRHYVFE